jgi:TrmH family RNA methyltransferase
MLSTNQIKKIRSLHQMKFRKELGLFIAEGPKIVEEMLHAHYRIESIYATEDWVEEKKVLVSGKHVEVVKVTAKELQRISNLSTANTVLAVCRMPERDIKDIDDEDGLMLALDGIRNPGNMGTIIRTADWFGVKSIICSNDCVETFNPKVVQASMGSLARVKVYYTDLETYLKKCKLPVYATVLGGKSVWEAKVDRGIFVIGNESGGIRGEVLKHAKHLISIPSSEGGAESLNAAVAAGVVLAILRKA